MGVGGTLLPTTLPGEYMGLKKTDFPRACARCGVQIKTMKNHANKQGKCRRRCNGIAADKGGYPLDPILREQYRLKIMNKKAAKQKNTKSLSPKVLVRGPLFYETREWQFLRYKTIKKYERKCMVCFRSNLELHVDHIKPISKFPELALNENNLQVLCRDCNLGKGNTDSIDYRPKPIPIDMEPTHLKFIISELEERALEQDREHTEREINFLQNLENRLSEMELKEKMSLALRKENIGEFLQIAKVAKEYYDS